MKYIRNQDMEFLDIDEENLAVYDNESGDTHYIDATGKVILEILEEGTAYEDLIGQLCDMYAASEQEISDDVQAFLAELLSKKVVVCS